LTFLLFYDPSMKHDTGYDGVEGAADRARAWGTKKRFRGGADAVAGRVKEAVGRATGDDDLAGEGVLDQAAGTVKDAAGDSLDTRSARLSTTSTDRLTGQPE
jgi:uncharacterized protein YjbJ (UPF0337 family)